VARPVVSACRAVLGRAVLGRDGWLGGIWEIISRVRGGMNDADGWGLVSLALGLELGALWE
jgi:hypothetical protein